MDGESVFAVLFGLIVLGYIVLYVGGRNYLREYFQGDAGGQAGAMSATASELHPTPMPIPPPRESEKERSGECPKPGRVLMEYITPDTVAKQSVQSLDDYEYNYVFQQESDRGLSQALKNKLMSQRPMDWAGMPPSSAEFQAGLRESFQNAKPTVPDDAKPFKEVSGESMVPPDALATEMEERKVLQTYKPASANKMVTYEAKEEETPEQLIQRVYDVKGLVPTVAHKEGTNVYEVIGVRRKDEKILYEDEEAPASAAPVRGAGEARISVPPAAYDTTAAADPYYDTSAGAGKARTGKWDYQSWTPGLERMFAPSNPVENWY